MKKTIPGGLSAAHFLREFWQKKPLLIRQAYPGFGKLLSKEKLISLSCNEEIQSRLVRFHRRKWTLSHGPFKQQDFIKLKGSWALLVQDVNHFLPLAQSLLKAFNFIPHARLDDLMVSFAPDGGGVGPHFDSYDVFLLQGAGKRLWQISKQKDQSLLPDAPLRVLRNFKAEQEWLLESGDMLYLPPNYAHHGIAVGECMTYSIGFRAPSHQMLVNEFLFYLQDYFAISGMYKDPDLTLDKHPARIPEAMIDKVSTVLKKIQFRKNDIKHFLGKYLSEPKAQVFFVPPKVLLAKSKFLKLAQQQGIHLDLRSQMLFTDELLFMNGEDYSFKLLMKPLLKKLADEREVSFHGKLDEQTGKLLYEWYQNGYLHLLLLSSAK